MTRKTCSAIWSSSLSTCKTKPRIFREIRMLTSPTTLKPRTKSFKIKRRPQFRTTRTESLSLKRTFTQKSQKASRIKGCIQSGLNRQCWLCLSPLWLSLAIRVCVNEFPDRMLSESQTRSLSATAPNSLAGSITKRTVRRLQSNRNLSSKRTSLKIYRECEP